MERVRAIENKLAAIFKDLPALPKNAKKAIVQYWPYVVLVIGVLQLLAAWALWKLIDNYNTVTDFTNSLTNFYGVADVGLSSFDKTVIYLGIAFLVVEAVLLFMAYNPLLKRLRKGWELLFLVVLLQVVYSLVSVFVIGNGVGSLVANLIGAAIGFYFLFQIREFYGIKTVKSAEAKSQTA